MFEHLKEHSFNTNVVTSEVAVRSWRPNMETSSAHHKQFKDNSWKCLLNKYFAPDGLYCFYLNTSYMEIHCILKDYDLFEN